MDFTNCEMRKKHIVGQTGLRNVLCIMAKFIC